jgi:hypothetical protein
MRRVDSDAIRAGVSVCVEAGMNSPIQVREIDARQPIADARYVAVMFENQALVVDAVRGSTQLVPLLVPLDDKNLTGDERRTAIIESACREALFSGISVVYVLNYDIKPGDAVALMLPP